MQAIGMIETRGMLAAVEAADAMVKSANVRLYNKRETGGGLITVIVTGDVAAVTTAVDAGSAAASRVGSTFSAHVIPRPHRELDEMLAADFRPKPCKTEEPANPPSPEAAPPAESPPPSQAETAPEIEPENTPEIAPEIAQRKVTDLRSYLRRLPHSPLSPDEIRYANREKLLAAIRDAIAAGDAEQGDGDD